MKILSCQFWDEDRETGGVKSPFTFDCAAVAAHSLFFFEIYRGVDFLFFPVSLFQCNRVTPIECPLQLTRRTPLRIALAPELNMDFSPGPDTHTAPLIREA